MRSRTLGAMIFMVAALAPSYALAQQTRYVNGDCGDDAWTGLSAACQAPDGPKRTIQPAIDAAGDGDTVLVAPGFYTGGGNFGLQLNGRALTLRAQDGPESTIVDGAGTDNRFASIWSSTGAGVVIDGFTVTNFKDAGAPLGADHEGDLTIVNCRFIDNSGNYAGAIFWGGGAHPGTVKVYNCIFDGNTGLLTGGIFVEYGPLLEVTNCTFLDGQSTAFDGGTAAIYAGISVRITNSICRGGEPLQLFGEGQSTAAYCDIQGPLGGTFTDAGGNIDADALLVDPAAGVYSLGPGSPCIDAADNTTVPGWLTADIAGLPRFADDPATKDTGVGPPPVVDMGAHEFQQPCYPDFNSDGALDLFDYLAFINAFNGTEPRADCNGDGAFDLFDFLCFANAFNSGC